MIKTVRRQRGDTIIEVMIAVVILGAALAGALAISNRASRTTQDTHERYQAQLYINEQAELIRTQAYDGTENGRADFIASVVAIGGTFCMTPAGPVASSDPACIKTSYIPYTLTITPQSLPNPATGANELNMYYIKVQWDSLVGVGQVELAYGI